MFISIATTMPPADDQRSRLLMIGSLAICAMQEVLADNGITFSMSRAGNVVSVRADCYRFQRDGSRSSTLVIL